MKKDKLPQIRSIKNNSIVYKVVRSQRKNLSRYRLKKQADLIEQIMNDSQVMGL